MGFYEYQVLPRVINLACGASSMRSWREKALAGARGVTVEIGFGSGTNVPFYGPEIERVFAVEPSEIARKIAAKRIVRSAIPIELIGLDGQSIPLADTTCDTALSTFTLCTVPDPEQALAELHRVLKDDGTLHVLEHGLSPDKKVAKQQHQFDGLQAKLFGGCHLIRDTTALLEHAGFTITSVQQRYAKGAPKALSWFTVATCTKR
jgi:ubiquinone/menaquinone biosynthesis C-methylase UbiE